MNPPKNEIRNTAYKLEHEACTKSGPSKDSTVDFLKHLYELLNNNEDNFFYKKSKCHFFINCISLLFDMQQRNSIQVHYLVT